MNRLNKSKDMFQTGVHIFSKLFFVMLLTSLGLRFMYYRYKYVISDINLSFIMKLSILHSHKLFPLVSLNMHCIEECFK